MSGLGRIRNPERGGITIMACVLLTTLFGLAALAIGQGYLYSRSRLVYAIADSAVAAGMADLSAGNSSAAQTDATNMVDAHGSYTRTATATATTLKVVVSNSYPTFFSGLFGLTSRTVSASVTGSLNAGGPTLLALGGCGSGGVSLNGNTNLTVNGSMESNGPITYGTGPDNTTTNGNAQSPCAGQPNSMAATDTVTGSIAQAPGNFPDPFAAVPTSLPPCDYGTLGAPYNIPFGNWSAGGVLASGVYCSGGNLSISSPDVCQCIVANGVSFIATGNINFTSGGPTNPLSSISPAANMPDGIVAYSSGNGSPAIQFGNWDLTISGSLYAPNGQVMIGSQGTVTMTGSAVGNTVFLGMGNNATWTIGSPGGAGSTGWQMSQ
jgi:hypothetical protein